MRFCNFKIKFNTETWASWAEGAGINGKGINFALLYGDEIFAMHNNQQVANARSYTNFIKAISGIKDWSNTESLALILQIAKGCFLRDKDNIIGGLFTTFIANKLDKLIQPKDMLELTWDTLEPKMRDCVYDGETYRPEIASVLTIRFMNYVLHLLDTKGGIKENTLFDRILEIVDNDETLFSEDLLFHLIKTLVTRYPGRTGKLLTNAKIRNKVIL